MLVVTSDFPTSRHGRATVHCDADSTNSTPTVFLRRFVVYRDGPCFSPVKPLRGLVGVVAKRSGPADNGLAAFCRGWLGIQGTRARKGEVWWDILFKEW